MLRGIVLPDVPEEGAEVDNPVDLESSIMVGDIAVEIYQQPPDKGCGWGAANCFEL